MFQECVNEPFSTSDHQKIAFSLPIICPKYFSKKVLIRSFKDVTFRKLDIDIARIDWDVVISLMFCSNDKYCLITETILELFNKHFPLKPINKVIRENYPQKIKELNKRKLLLFRKIKNEQNGQIKNELKIEYKIISRVVIKELEQFNTNK